MPYKAFRHAILPYFRHRFTFKVLLLKIIEIISSVIPTFTAKQKEQQQSDARLPQILGETGQV